jgi:hypothetical protein
MIHEHLLKDHEIEQLAEAAEMTAKASAIRRRIRKRVFDRHRRKVAREKEENRETP